MAKTKEKSTSTGKEFYENPEVLAEKLSRTEELVEKNKTAVFIVLGVIALIVAGVFGYNYYMDSQNEEAQVEMFQAVFYFEADSLNKALNGDGNNYGFLDIIDNYGGTKSANLASFYVGATYLKQGQFEDAIDYLEEFKSDDLLLQPRAYALIGDAYMELGNYTKAAAYYMDAAEYKPNKYFSPIYLTKAAIAYEKVADYMAALSCYETILKDFWDWSDINEAKKQKSRLEELAS
jgi:tetratricopeptide (TPR) repeat protein